MDQMLKDKVAIITGSGRGIGRGAAELFAVEGAKVVVCDMDDAACHQTVQYITKSGGVAISVVGDITTGGFPEHIVMKAIEAFGPSIDIVVNNAGYGGGDFIDRTTDAFWERMFEIHATAPFRLIRAACPFMRDRARGGMESGMVPPCRKIINITSLAGTDGLPSGSAYSSAKAALIGLTKSLSKELGSFNICVNAISFGLIDTRLTQPLEQGIKTVIEGTIAGFPSKFREEMIRMTPLRRAGTAQEAAKSILMLASPLADFISGQVIKVSGGLW